MRMSDVVRLGVLGLLYMATAKLGLALDAVQGFATAVWPPTGIALAALVLYGTHLWPSIAVGAFLVNWSAGAPVLVAGGMALGNTLEALIGTVLLTRVVRFRPTLDRLRDVVGLLVWAAGLSTLVSATLGVTSGWLGGGHSDRPVCQDVAHLVGGRCPRGAGGGTVPLRLERARPRHAHTAPTP